MITTKAVRLTIKPLKGGSNEALTESAQCVYLAAAQFARKNIDSDFVKRNMIRTASRVDVNFPTNEIVDKLSPAWQKSCEKIANELRRYLKRTDYVFHRDSPIVKSIYAKFNELNKAEGKRFANTNKWQPADIWAIAGVVNVSKIKSIEELNQYLRAKLEAGMIIPISLKMVAPTAQVKIEPTNLSNTPKPMFGPIPKFDHIRVSTGKSNWTSSNQSQIRFKLANMKTGWFELRTFDSQGDVRASLNLSENQRAQHGKVNGKEIAKYVREAGGYIPMPDIQQLRQQSYHLDSKLIDKVYTLAQKLAPANTSREEFVQTLKSKTSPSPLWLSSKLQSMTIVQAFENLVPQKKDEVVQRMYSYAKAEGELTAPFLKVS